MTGIPTGMHSITPHLMVSDARAALELYQKAFGAEIIHVLELPGTKMIMHASFRIGDSTMFISDEIPGGPRKAPAGNLSSVAFYLYSDDVDAAFIKAKAGGLDAVSEPEDMFWGDRTAVLHDPFGHNWTLATQLREVSPDEMAETMKQMAPA